MSIARLDSLQDFGVRSLLIHAIMVVTFVGALAAGFLVSGDGGTVAFVALLTFTAGLWLSHSIHSLGNAAAGEDYGGVIEVLSRDVD